MGIITQAIVAREPQNVPNTSPINWEFETVTVGEPGDDEVLVEIVASGVCHTDLVLTSIPGGAFGVQYPKIAGHEGAGYVRKIGCNITSVAVNDPVLLSFYSCGACEQCEDQHPAFCHTFDVENYMGRTGNVTMNDKDTGAAMENIQTRFFGQSSFARYTIVDKSSVVNAKDLIKNDRELRLFSPLGCGFQTGMGAVENMAGAGPQSVVVILGMGSVGAAALMTAKVLGCREIIAVDRVKSRLELAKELGATQTIDTSTTEKSLAEAVRGFIPHGASIVIETTGVPTLIEDALQALGKRGKLVVIGVPPAGYELGVSLVQHMNTGRSIIGCIEGDCIPSQSIPRMIQWYREGKFPIDKLVSYFKAPDFKQALAAIHEGSVVKAVLEWGPETLCKEA